ncbi:MAG TPA: TRAP transporter small permease subunit [Burkholderiales bacterium]|jgi:TRAP-type C4-dicarboxylate transport system permease small subunit|nr:TRAP transporter small permease subunit [Burkholderiales bacterium]
MSPGGGAALPRLAALLRVHDALTRTGFAAAVLLLAVIACSFTYEVTARYLFNAPTEWASPLVSYSLVAAIFLAMPELTRRKAHMSLNLLADSVSPAWGAAMNNVSRTLAAVACLLAAWFCADATLNQIELGVWTSPPFALPKWVISIWLPYGFLSSGLYFLRALREPPVRAAAPAP